MRNVKTKLLYGVLAVGGIAVHLATVGGTAALAHALGPWAYPTHFGIGCFQFGAVLSFPWFRKYLVFNEERFSKGIWPWIRKRGAFAFVMAASVLVSPFLAAVVIRFLALPERKAWLYGFVSTATGTLIWISIYLGAVTWIRSLLSSAF
ncbi:MAG TPA: hypothetical protein VL426_05470 [Candidatus Binatia bacterium]|nr:hypothetical protein [Candidatus Binatia bacterium]